MFLPGKATMTFYVLSVVGLLLVSFVSQGKCQTTAPPPPRKFRHFLSKCLWCFTTNNCTDYPVTWLLPPASLCPLSQARWGVCWLNFEALIIALAVVAGTILISISVCCCCCCCCKRRRPGPDRDEERFARRREEIRQRAEER
uniref:PTTG1 interacting protein n=1 Tax=Xiphophorus couchianus TaxID=32473 RepID=A0A3B5MGU3_9TELE